jgi:hypothetical protein
MQQQQTFSTIKTMPEGAANVTIKQLSCVLIFLVGLITRMKGPDFLTAG